MLHAWWGLKDEILQHAGEMARSTGFLVMVPDLFRGKVTTDDREASHFADDLDWTAAVKDVEACARNLKSRGCRKVGVIGFCIGGALAILSATLVDDVTAAASFYAIPKPHLADLTKITKPVRGHFGENDAVSGFSSPEDYLPFAEKMKNAGVPFQLHIYDGVGHGFVHPSYNTYKERPAKLALTRLYAFMERTLL